MTISWPSLCGPTESSQRPRQHIQPRLRRKPCRCNPTSSLDPIGERLFPPWLAPHLLVAGRRHKPATLSCSPRRSPAPANSCSSGELNAQTFSKIIPNVKRQQQAPTISTSASRLPPPPTFHEMNLPRAAQQKIRARRGLCFFFFFFFCYCFFFFFFRLFIRVFLVGFALIDVFRCFPPEFLLFSF